MSSLSCTGPKPRKPDRTSAALRGTGNGPIHPWGRPLNLAQWTDAVASHPIRNPGHTATVYILQLVFRFRSLWRSVRFQETLEQQSVRQTSGVLGSGSAVRRLYKNSPGPLWRSAGGETAGICVELYSVEVPLWFPDF